MVRHGVDKLLPARRLDNPLGCVPVAWRRRRWTELDNEVCSLRYAATSQSLSGWPSRRACSKSAASWSTGGRFRDPVIRSPQPTNRNRATHARRCPDRHQASRPVHPTSAMPCALRWLRRSSPVNPVQKPSADRTRANLKPVVLQRRRDQDFFALLVGDIGDDLAPAFGLGAGFEQARPTVKPHTDSRRYAE